MAIPNKDLSYFLPIRWAFYEWTSGKGSGGWQFAEWREYLLDDAPPNNQIMDMLNDKRFLVDVNRFLAENKANNLNGLIVLWQKCCREYEGLVRENGITD